MTFVFALSRKAKHGNSKLRQLSRQNGSTNPDNGLSQFLQQILCLKLLGIKKWLQVETCSHLILLHILGADCRDRTGHLMITSQLLYQMS
jgi:hypothetical protein